MTMTRTYSISIANHGRIGIASLYNAAMTLGLAATVRRLESLNQHGCYYSNEDFDVLSSACYDLKDAGFDYLTLATR